MKACKVLLVIFSLILYSLTTSASHFAPQWYYNYQKIDIAQEEVTLEGNDLKIKFEGVILVDKELYKESDWVVFSFNPKYSVYNTISDYESSVSLRTGDFSATDPFEPNKEAEYSTESNEYGIYYYNVSLKSLEGYNYIIFHANFTLKDAIRRIRDYTYRLYYSSETTSNNFYIDYILPSYTDVKDVTVQGEWHYGTFSRFVPAKEDRNKGVYFLFENEDEKKDAEKQEKDVEEREKIMFLLLGGLFSLVITIVYENLIKKDKKIFGNIEIKQFKKYKRAIIKIFNKNS